MSNFAHFQGSTRFFSRIHRPACHRAGAYCKKSGMSLLPANNENNIAIAIRHDVRQRELNPQTGYIRYDKRVSDKGCARHKP